MTVTPGAVPSRSLTHDSQLIEDYLHVTEVLVDSNKEHPIAVILNGAGQSEVLAIHTDGQLYHVCREPMSDSGWNMFGVGAGLRAVAAAGAGVCWGVGTDSALWKREAGRWTCVAETIPGGRAILDVSLGTDGTIYAATDALDFPMWWSENGGKSWNALMSWTDPGTLPVGSSTNLWAMDLAHSIFTYNGQHWQPIAAPADTAWQISVGSDGSVFLLGEHTLWQYGGQEQWRRISDAQELVHIAAVDAGNLWAVARPGSGPYAVQQYANGQWQTVASPLSVGDPSHLPSVSAAADGSVSLVDSYGVAFQYLGNGTWQKQSTPTGMKGYTATLGGVDEVAAGADAHGVQHAFFVAGGTLYHARLEPNGGWSFDSIAACSGIGTTNQLDSRELIAYGASPDGSLLIARDNGSAWIASTFVASPSLQGATVQVNAIDADNWYTFALIGTSLHTALGSSSNPLPDSQSSPNHGPLWPMNPYPDSPAMPTISKLARVPMFNLGTIYVAVVDPGGNLYLVSKIGVETTYFNAGFGIFEKLTGTAGVPLASVTSAAGVLGPDGLLRIFATDTSDKLWILRETTSGNRANGAPWFGWSAWHPLGDGARYLANGPGTLATSELYTLDADWFLVYLSQNAGQHWSAKAIKKPAGASDAPDYVAQYVTQVTVLDQHGNADSDVAVTVTTDEPVSVWIDGAQYEIDAGNPLTVTTNGSGSVTLSTPALGLHTARLTFQVDGLADPYPVYPPQHAHDRLSAIDGGTLGGATAQTQGLPPVVQPLSSNASSADFTTAAKAINDLFQIPIDPGAGSRKALCRIASPRTTPAALHAGARSSAAGSETLSGAAPGDAWESFWQDLSNCAEDVYRGIRTGVMQVQSVGVDIEHKFVSLAVSIENIGSAVLEFSIYTLQDIADALHSFFAYIEATVERALDWLKQLFEWQDIINTKRVIEHYLSKVLDHIHSDLASPQLQALVQEQFANLGTNISNALTNMEAAFGGATFNGLANGPSTSARRAARGLGNSLQPAGLMDAYQSNKVRVDYVTSKSHTYFQTGGTLNGSTSAEALPGDAFGDFLQIIDQKILQNSNYASALQSLQGGFDQLQNAQSLFDMAITDFLKLAQDLITLVIDALEAIVIGALKLAGDALAGLNDLLNTPINIPAVSYIYQQLSGAPLTLLDLGCLLMAMPATIIYKASWGGAAANPPFTTDPNAVGIVQVSDVIGRDIPWPSLGAAAPTGTRNSLLQASPSLIVTLGIEYVTLSIWVGANDAWLDLASSKGKATPTPVITFFSICGVVLGLVSQAFCVPYPLFTKENRSNADTAYLSLWSVGFLPLLIDGLFIFLSNSKAAARFTGNSGVLATVVGGAALLGVGIWAAVEEASDPNYNPFYQTQAIVAPVPQVAKFLLMTQNNVALAILLGLDVLCDVGNGAMGYLEATS